MTPYDIKFGSRQLSEFGAVCTEFPLVVGGDMKEPYSNDWNDEDGKDVYIPSSGVKEGSYEIQMSIAAKGSNVATTVRNIIDYLKSAGKMTIENTYVGYTYNNAYLEKYSNSEYFYDDAGDKVAVFSLTFVVTNE